MNVSSAFFPSDPQDKLKTQAEMRQWQTDRENLKDDFPFIALTKGERKLLKATELNPVEITDKLKPMFKRMQQLNFIGVEEHDELLFMVANRRGINYLRYIEGIEMDKRKTTRREFLLCVISAVLGALLSQPFLQLFGTGRIPG